MCLIVESQNLLAALKDIHTVMGAKAAILDTDFKEIISYPEEPGPSTCSPRVLADVEKYCRNCGQASRSGINASGDSHIFICPFGLRVAIAPIRDETGVIGYLTAGPFVDSFVPTGKLCEDAKRECVAFDGEYGQERDFRLLPRITDMQAAAFAGIIDAYTSHIIQREFVKARRQSDFIRIRDYIDSNLGEDLSAARLCSALYIPRNALFKLIRDETGTTPSQYVLKKRLNYAKRLLREADVNILSISELCGIDFNYFSRLFKKEFGQSPREYRKGLV